MFRSLCAAIDADLHFRAYQEADEESVAIAINTCLVLAGVRSAARLDLTVIKLCKPSKFMKTLVRLQRPNIQVVCVAEPLVINVKLASSRDVAIVKEHYGGMSDLEQPLVGAMGRLLGYKCAPLGMGAHKQRARALSLVAMVQIAFKKPERVYLAGFSCGEAVSATAFDKLKLKMQREWVEPACAAVVGCDAKIFKTTCRVLGFYIDVEER